MTIQQHASFDTNAPELSAAGRLAKAWESKNAKNAAKAGGISLMALSLAACGGSSTTTTTSTSTETSTTTTTVTPASVALTIGVDAVAGTAGADTISGARIDTVQTWNSGDTIAAGEGTDTLTAVISANVTPATGAITGVENIVVTALGNSTVDFGTATTASISGVTSITNIGSSATLAFTDVQTIPVVNIDNAVAAATTTVSIAAAALTGTDDALTLNVNGVAGAVAIGSVGAIDGTGIEALTINATGSASTFSAANLDAAASAVTITGEANLDIDGATSFAKLATLSAGDATGNLSLQIAADTVAGATNTKTITTGAGDDAVNIDDIVATTVGAVSVNTGAGDDTLTVTTIEADYTLDGGAGTGDRLVSAETITSAIGAGVSGFEVFEYGKNAGTQVLSDVGGTNAFTTVTAGAATTTINGIASTVTTLEIKGGVATTAATFDLRTDNATGDSITVKATTATAALTGDLGIDDFESVTFDTSAFSLDVQGDTASSDLDAVTLVGDNAIAIGGTGKEFSSTTLATIDASGITGTATAEVYAINSTVDMTVTGPASTGAFTIFTGSGKDTVTAGGGSLNATTGAGDDTITGGTAADTITGGTGNDTINIDDATSVEDVLVMAEYGINNYDIITGFETGTAATDDEMTLNLAGFGFNANAGDNTAALTTAATLKAAIAGAGGTNDTLVTISTDMADNSIDRFLDGTNTVAEFEANAITAIGLTGTADNAAVIGVFVDDGENTAFLRFAGADAGTDDLAADTELEVVAIFMGVSDATDIVIENFNAFS